MPAEDARPRIAPLEPPYAPDTASMLAKWMPPGSDVEPLGPFRTLAVHGSSGDACWDERQSAVMSLAEELHATSTISEELRQRLRTFLG